MKITCSLCDVTQEIDPNTPLGKHLSNHPLKTFLCTRCHDRITEKINKRLSDPYVSKEDKVTALLP